MKIDDNVLHNYSGGGKNYLLVTLGAIGATIGGLITLLIGMVDGFERPLKCN